MQDSDICATEKSFDQFGVRGWDVRGVEGSPWDQETETETPEPEKGELSYYFNFNLQFMLNEIKKWAGEWRSCGCEIKRWMDIMYRKTGLLSTIFEVFGS